jgi:GNAT superfamily N-acetyltransferase
VTTAVGSARVAEIRPFEHADVPGVVALLRAHMGGWPLDERALVGLMLDHPWAEEDLRSLVAVERERIVGFTGVQSRRLRLDGEPLRGVCCTHAVVAPEHRGAAIGARLLSTVLSGPQALTWADSATDAVAGVYRIHGGHLDHARACDWMLVLRPFRWLGGLVAAAARRERVTHRMHVPVGALPAQAAGPRVLRRAFPESAGDVVGADATVAEIVDHVPALNHRRRLWVDHDEEQLDHLFRLVETFRRPLVHRLVRRSGRPIGWYAYLPRRGGASRVLHLAAPDREIDAVLGELVSHARVHGSAVLTGRAEPHLQTALDRRFAVLGYARQPVLHAADAEVAALLATGSSLLTRLEGEVFGI